MLLQKIEEDLKTAQKEKNELTVSALRNLKAAFTNAQIEKGSELTDEDAAKVVAKKVKQHKDSIESFRTGNRTDLVETEQKQMEVLQKYLPKAMDESEVEKIVKDTIIETNATAADFGKVMKEVLGKLKGQADGSVVSRLVKENLK